MGTIMDLGIVCFSVHILLPVLQSPEAIRNAPIPQHFRKGVLPLCFPWFVSCLFGWFLVYFLCFIIFRVFKSSGSCGGLYKYDIECSFGDCLLPQLLFLVSKLFSSPCYFLALESHALSIFSQMNQFVPTG